MEIAHSPHSAGILDKGFCSKPVFQGSGTVPLELRDASFPVRGESVGVRVLFQGKSCTTASAFNRPTYGQHNAERLSYPLICADLREF
jgi:hypothetical protein